jgi:hypothetical protein
MFTRGSLQHKLGVQMTCIRGPSAAPETTPQRSGANRLSTIIASIDTIQIFPRIHAHQGGLVRST